MKSATLYSVRFTKEQWQSVITALGHAISDYENTSAYDEDWLGLRNQIGIDILNQGATPMTSTTESQGHQKALTMMPMSPNARREFQELLAGMVYDKLFHFVQEWNRRTGHEATCKLHKYARSVSLSFPVGDGKNENIEITVAGRPS